MMPWQSVSMVPLHQGSFACESTKTPKTWSQTPPRRYEERDCRYDTAASGWARESGANAFLITARSNSGNDPAKPQRAVAGLYLSDPVCSSKLFVLGHALFDSIASFIELIATIEPWRHRAPQARQKPVSSNFDCDRRAGSFFGRVLSIQP